MNSTSNAADLFDMAESLGELSSDSVALLDPLQTEINAALATGTQKKAARLVLFTTNIDNSASMEYRCPGSNQNNWEIAADGHDLILGALCGSKAASTILAHSTFLAATNGNNGIHFPFKDLVLPGHSSKSPKPNFDSMPKKVTMVDSTPLCDAMIRVLGSVQAQSTVYTQDGTDVFTITIFLSDGGNNAGSASTSDVATLVADLRRQERHKIYFGGIEDGYTDFRKFGAECGLDPECVRTLPNDPSEIRAWLEQVSQSAVAGSEAADVNAFSQIKL
ncbi:MAG TPA: hypothetical protein PKA63_06905 [Oligoflexia bacterium]|nr:hypothetical protein [Oligoflexia bacterium]HMP48379.1 hypothetical protein [Oligoflexia bacterium]